MNKVMVWRTWSITLLDVSGHKWLGHGAGLENYPSNFELIHLAYDSMMDDEILWLVAQYCAYVYGQKKQKAHNYIINVDKLRSHLMGLYAINQKSQNVLAHIPF